MIETENQVIEIVKNYLKNGAFSDRKITDTPTDDLQVVNKKYVDDNGFSFKQLLTTNFETVGRFSQATGGSGAITFGTSGVDIETGATATSFATVKWALGGNNQFYSFNNSPSFGASFDMYNSASNHQAFVGLGNLTVDGTNITFTGVHIGFKMVNGILYATQADGATETASILLNPFGATDTISVYAKMNAGTSVDYYYSQNGVTFVGPLNLTTNIPDPLNVTAAAKIFQFSVNNNGQAVLAGLDMQSAFYLR